MKYKSYSNELKEKIVKEYLAGMGSTDITTKYNINKSQLYHWKKQYKEFGIIPDGRGKTKSGERPKLNTIDISKMTKDEYIAYLEMENDILKYLASLKKKNQK